VTLAAALLTYSGQLLIVVAIAAVAAAAVGLSLPAARLQYWRAVILLGLLLPAVPDLGADRPAATVTFQLAGGALVPAAPAAASTLAGLGSLVPYVVGLGIAARLAWLVVGALRLRQLRRRSEPARLSPDLVELHQAIAPVAAVRQTTAISQPVAFGWTRPIVLLPPRFATLTTDAQRAVLCHELLHVCRCDWPGIVLEELLRAVFWFHPAMWWALDQVHLNREAVVDRAVVARTPVRRAYMDALLAFAVAPDARRPAIAFLRRRHLAARLRQLAKEPHMTRLRLVTALVTLVIVLAGSAVAVLIALPLDVRTVARQRGASLEVRLAELQPGAGLVEAVVQGSTRKVYLHPGAVVTGADVTGARVLEAGGGRFSIGVEFSATGSNRLAESTKIHVGRPLAVLLDGRVIAAPVLRGMIRGSAVISGGFTREEADRIAAGFGAPGAAAVPRRYTGQDDGVVLPAVLTEVKPQYTPAAMQAKIQGEVLLSATVRADGSVADVAVIDSLDPTYGLDDAAVAALRQWTFTPGTKDGRPVDVEVHVTVRFTLA
jgi:TonB family protein